MLNFGLQIVRCSDILCKDKIASGGIILMEHPNKHWTDWLVIVATAILMALSYAIFVFPNSFAPAGINGIITMIQYLLHIDIGYLSLAVNLPLFLLTWKSVGRDFAVKSMVYVLVFSVVSLLLKRFDLSGICYHTENGTSLILVWVIFFLNACVAAVSFFVYGWKFEPVIMCLIYCYVSSKISDSMLRGNKKALKFEVVTDRADELAEVLLRQMRHGVTVIPAEGMFSKQEKKLLVCIVNRHQIVQFQNILCRFPGSFAYVSEVTETMGNFKHITH